MSYDRNCLECGRNFTAKRPHARYCSEPCSMQGWVREQVEPAPKRVEDREKVRWEVAIDQAIRSKLIATGEVHANDIDDLPVPHQLRNLIGNRFRVFTSRRLMAKTGEYVPVKHPAAHGRSAPVYRITPKGRAELVGLGGVSNDDGVAAVRPPAGSSLPGHSSQSDESGTGGRGQAVGSKARPANATPGVARPESPAGLGAGGGGDARKDVALRAPLEASVESGGLPAARVAHSAPPESSPPGGSGGRDEAQTGVFDVYEGIDASGEVVAARYGGKAMGTTGQLFELPRRGNALTDPEAA